MRPAQFSNPVNEFEALFQEVLPAALKTAVFLCGDRDDAEDLVQDAAVQAFRQFARFEPGTNFKAWFLKVQHNCFLSRLRHESRRPQTVTIETEEVESLFIYQQTHRAGFGCDPAKNFLARLDEDQIAAAIGGLPVEFRAVCALFFVHELGYEQIAEITETPLGTVRSRLHRGRHCLQKVLWELAKERGLVDPELAPIKGRKTANHGAATWLLFLLVPFNLSMIHRPTGGDVSHAKNSTFRA